MGYQERVTLSPEKRRGRETLTSRDPIVERALEALQIDDFDIGETRLWGNRLSADVRRFEAGRPAFGERGLIGRREAAILLRIGLDLLKQGRAA